MSLSGMWEAAAFSNLYPCHSGGQVETALACLQPRGMNSKLLVSLALSEVGWEFWDMAGDRGQIRHRERTLQNQVGLSHLILEITPWGGILCCPHFPARGQIIGVCVLLHRTLRDPVSLQLLQCRGTEPNPQGMWGELQSGNAPPNSWLASSFMPRS